MPSRGAFGFGNKLSNNIMQLQSLVSISLNRSVLLLGLSTPLTAIAPNPARAEIPIEATLPLEMTFSTQAEDLLPIDPALPGDRAYEFNWVREVNAETNPASSNGDDPEDDFLSETGKRGQFKIPIGRGAFSYGFGSLIGEPTALEGVTRELPVSAQSTRLAMISLAGHLQQKLTEHQRLLLEFKGDFQLLGFDLSYTHTLPSSRGAWSVNFFNQRSLSPAFEHGEIEVNLPNGNDPWVHRTGGGVEYTHTLSPRLDIATAFNYQRISVRDAAFTHKIEPVDELGNRLTVSDKGQDDLLTLSLTGFLDEVGGRDFVLQGTRVQFGIDQSIPVGDADILFTRFVGNATQFIPLQLFTSEPGNLVLNLQGGVTFGDVSPYESLSLGGISSIRGFRRGEIGSSRSFIQATVEYRFPLFSLSLLDVPVKIGGVLFVDYGSDFGTADATIGNPAEVRGKPGDGLGYGIGLHGVTSIGLLRLELGFNDRGGSEIHFAIGDRF